MLTWAGKYPYGGCKAINAVFVEMVVHLHICNSRNYSRNDVYCFSPHVVCQAPLSALLLYSQEHTFTGKKIKAKRG